MEDGHTKPNETPRRAPEGLVLTDGASRILGCSEFTARKYARERKIPSYRLFGARGRYAFKREDLEAFVEAGRLDAAIADVARERLRTGR